MKFYQQQFQRVLEPFDKNQALYVNLNNVFNSFKGFFEGSTEIYVLLT